MEPSSSKSVKSVVSRMRLAIVAFTLLLILSFYGIYYRYGDYKLITINAENHNLTTFPACEMAPNAHYFQSHPEYFANSSSNLVKELPEYEENKLKEILQSTAFPPRSTSSSGFVKTVIAAYRSHHNLVIRPDDIWAAILTQFSFYINKNAEKFRNKFVNFEGKKKLVISFGGGTIYTIPYDVFVNLIIEEIDKNMVDPKVKEWIMPSFSTTTQNDYVSIGVVFMATMKHYFSYEARIMCGIPEITIDGTAKDWKDILGRLEKLKEYELEKWYDMLYPIISKFVDAKEGKVDGWFWKGIVNLHPQGRCGTPDIISGWITAFSVFDNDGNWQDSKEMDDDDEEEENGQFLSRLEKFWHSMTSKWPRISVDEIPRGVVEVDVTLNEHGKEYKSLMLAGHMAVEVKEDGFTMQPLLGWAIALKPEKSKYFIQ